MNPADLSQLYRNTVMDHSRNPRNFRRIDSPQRFATGHNPLCGDKVTVSLNLTADGVITDAAFEGQGCAISVASASILTELIKNQRASEVVSLIRNVCATFVGDTQETPPGDMAALAGVRDYPSRIRCATLPWRTLQAALLSEAATATTE